MIHLRGVKPSDLGALHALNESEVPHLGTVTLERMQTLIRNSLATRVAVDEHGAIAGFVIVFDQTSDYDSANFIWFQNHYPKFTYVDRIAVNAAFRGQGIGRLIYDDVTRIAIATSSPVVTCEVNVLPPNPNSMQFHHHLGFKEVGTLSSGGGTKKVAMLALPLA